MLAPVEDRVSFLGRGCIDHIWVFRPLLVVRPLQLLPFRSVEIGAGAMAELRAQESSDLREPVRAPLLWRRER